MQAFERLVEGLERGLLGEEGVETGLVFGRQSRVRRPLVGLEIPVETPDLAAHPFMVQPLRVVQRNQLVHQPLGVHPAQSMIQEGKLACPVADNGQIERGLILQKAAQQRSENTDNQVTGKAEAFSFHNLAGKPTGQDSNQKKNYYVHPIPF